MNKDKEKQTNDKISKQTQGQTNTKKTKPTMFPTQDEIGELLASDKWLSVTLEARQLSRHLQSHKDPLQSHREGRSLLLAGTSEGHIALVMPHNGVPESSVKGHQGAVTAIACHPKKHQVVSAGTGKTWAAS